MVKPVPKYFTSIGRKQVVATTGLLLILFIIGHLVGNLLFYGGPDLYNGYAHFLKKLRPGLFVIEGILGVIFLVHIVFTYLLIHDNIRARPKNYKLITHKTERSFAAQIMPITGTILFAFILFHLWDFTFTPHDGSQSILSDGKNYGLYGLVYNAFSDVRHSSFYIIAMMCIGFHLSHGIESFFQTYGFRNLKHESMIRMISQTMGVVIALAFSSIPIYVLFKNLSGGL